MQMQRRCSWLYNHAICPQKTLRNKGKYTVNNKVPRTGLVQISSNRNKCQKTDSSVHWANFVSCWRQSKNAKSITRYIAGMYFGLEHIVLNHNQALEIIWWLGNYRQKGWSECVWFTFLGLRIFRLPSATLDIFCNVFQFLISIWLPTLAWSISPSKINDRSMVHASHFI